MTGRLGVVRTNSSPKTEQASVGMRLTTSRFWINVGRFPDGAYRRTVFIQISLPLKLVNVATSDFQRDAKNANVYKRRCTIKRFIEPSIINCGNFLFLFYFSTMLIDKLSNVEKADVRKFDNRPIA